MDRAVEVSLICLQHEINELIENPNNSKNSQLRSMEKELVEKNPKRFIKIAKEICSNYEDEITSKFGTDEIIELPNIDYKAELSKLEREFEDGMHSGKNERLIIKRMKELSSRIKVNSSHKYRTYGFWTLCRKTQTVVLDPDPWDGYCRQVEVKCDKCLGSGFTFEVREERMQ